MPSFADHKRAMYDEHLQLDNVVVNQGYLMNELVLSSVNAYEYSFFSGKRGFFRRCVFLHADKKSFKG